MRQYALIRGCFGLTPAELDAMDDEEYWTTWGQAKYCLETMYQLKFE